MSIAVSSGKQLKITHVLTLTLPAVFAPVSFPVTGLGTVTGVGGCWATDSNIQTLFQQLLQSTGTNFNAHFPSVALPAHAQATQWFVTAGSGASMTVDAYVGGSRKRTRRVTLSTSQFNGSINELIFGVHVSSQAAIISGFLIKLDAPINKTASNTLSFVMDVSFNRV
ncbi:hypothetical protein [Deinococcus misasensis]|uniref:hypothetical protein n=1 Tax=Deinococcus misasensis TaxID=392413 RepID=UPI0005566776|nr:hypothetical protein [Deinococcus misasensis]